MKSYLIGLCVIAFIFSSCSKESKCIKGELLGYNPCTKSWGVQIINGPKIGTTFGRYNNVIELYDAPTDRFPGAIVYFKYKKKESKTKEEICITILPNTDYSTVEKSLVSWSESECP